MTGGLTFGGIAAGLLGLYFMGTASYGKENRAMAGLQLPECRADADATSVPEPVPGQSPIYWVLRGDCFGRADTLMIVGKFLQEPFRFCVPPEATTVQGLKVAVAYMEAHPERLHLDLTLLMAEAFRQAWPCKE